MPDGSVIKKQDFLDLWRKLDSEIMYHKLKPIHFTVKEMDRQNVRIAAETLSRTVAGLFRKLFPNDTAKNTLANFIELAKLAFNILTSTHDDHFDFSKSSFGGKNIEKQLQVLEDFHDQLSKTKFSGKPRFNNGALICIKANILLQETLAKKHNIQSFKTRNTSQVFLAFIVIQ